MRDALEGWQKGGCESAIIEVDGNATYELAKPASGRRNAMMPLVIRPDGARLVIQSADRPRPHLKGNLVVLSESSNTELTLRGLELSGQLIVCGPMRRLIISDCTLVPGKEMDANGSLRAPLAPSLVAHPLKTNHPQRMTPTKGIIDYIAIDHSSLGPLQLPSQICHSLNIWNSVVTAPKRVFDPGRGLPKVTHQLPAIGGGTSPRARGPSTYQEGTTFSGSTNVSFLEAAREDPQETHNLVQREGALMAQLEEYLRFGLELGIIYVT